MRMKHIGIVGVTAEGAALCYRTIVSEAAKLLGQNKHPEISLHNHPFALLAELQMKKDWDGLSDQLSLSVKKLASIGADFAIMPSNSPHYAIDLIRKKSPIPVMSIVEATVNEVKEKGFKRFAILGIGITMTDGLYEKPLKTAGIDPVIPNKLQQDVLIDVIYNYIIPDKSTTKSTQKVIAVINQLKEKKCDSVGLCCTELPIIITKENSPLPFVDTTRLIAKKALEYAIEP